MSGQDERQKGEAVGRCHMEQLRQDYIAALVAGMERVRCGEAWATDTGAERDAYIAAGANSEDIAIARVRAEERARYGAVVAAITQRRHAEEGPLVLLALREMHDRACIAGDWAPDHETPWRRVANQLRAALAALGEGGHDA